MAMKELKKFNTRFEADNFAIVLNQHGIPYIIQSADSERIKTCIHCSYNSCKLKKIIKRQKRYLKSDKND